MDQAHNTGTIEASTRSTEMEYGVPVACSSHVASSGAGPPANTDASR